MSTPEKQGYRPDIDGLRAIAILAVVAYHAHLPGFGGGFVGVDVFFVISGFLITRLLSLELETTGRISFRDFYARRFRRLMPAFFAVVAVTLSLWLLFVPSDLKATGKLAASVRWSVIGLANIFFKRNTFGYFDGPTSQMPLLHLWSLAVEEQFYLCWPLLLIALALVKGRITRIALLSLVVAASFVASWLLVHQGHSPSAFYWMPARAWELGIGAGLALFSPGPARAASQGRSIPVGIAHAAPFAGLALIAAAVTLYSTETPFPGLSALLPVLGTALLIRFPAPALLARKPLVRIGVLSYGWYLWHWPLLAMAQVWNLGTEPPLPQRLAILAFSLVLAEASLRWVEAPFRHGDFWKKLRPLRVVAAGGIASAALLGAGFALPWLEARAIGYRVGPELVRQVEEHSPLTVNCFDESAIGTDRCDFSFAEGGKAPARLAVWGDSHSGSYFPMLEAYARAHHLGATQYCHGDIPPLLEGPVTLDGSPGSFGESVIRDLHRKIAAGEKVSVVLTSRWMNYSGKQPIAAVGRAGFLDPVHTPEASQRAMRARLRNTLAELDRIGVSRVLVMLPYPEFRYYTLPCLQRDPGACAVKRAELESFRADVVALMSETVREFPHARVVDPLPVVCHGDTCHQVLDGMPVVIDDNHPSLKAVVRIGEERRADLDWLAGF